MRGHSGVLVWQSEAFSTTLYEALTVIIWMCYSSTSNYEVKRLYIGWGKVNQTCANVIEGQNRCGKEDGRAPRRGERFLPKIAHRRNLDYISPTPGSVHFLSGHGPYKVNLYIQVWGERRRGVNARWEECPSKCLRRKLSHWQWNDVLYT